MVINREFFFRGWLPAGLLVNARLDSSTSSPDDTILRPLLNPSPNASWRHQPSVAFPVSQATESVAVLLRDPLPEGAIVMLPLEEWYGSGTPYILATNVWYEGRIQEVSGGDVMAVRISYDQEQSATLRYYSNYEGVASPDVQLITSPCKWIPGQIRDQRAFRDTNKVVSEVGYIPIIDLHGSETPLPVMDVKKITALERAGMFQAFSTKSADSAISIILCEVVAGRNPFLGGVRYVGMLASVAPSVQRFYSVVNDEVRAAVSGAVLIKAQMIGVLSVGPVNDQVVHYN